MSIPVVPDHWLFVVMPAAAALIALTAFVVRYIRWRGRPAATRVPATVDDVAGVGAIWRLAIAIVLAGHLLAFAFPERVLLWNRQPVRLLLLEGTGLLAGALALGAFVVMVVKRQLSNERRGARSVLEVVAGTLVAVEVISGLAIAILYRWASSWSGVTLVPYLLSLIQMKPAVELVAGMPFLVRLHLVCAFALLAVAPFTERVRLVFVPLDRLTSWIVAPIGAIRRPVRSTVEGWSTRRVRNEREER